MFHLSYSRQTLAKFAVILLGVITVIVVARASIADANRHLTATVSGSAAAIRQGPAWGYGLVDHVAQNENVEVTARNADNSWMMVESENTEGWLATEKLVVSGSFEKLPVTDSPLPGAELYPTVKTYQKLVGLRNNPDWNDSIVTSLWPGLDIIAVARSAEHNWIFVDTDLGSGWVSQSAVIAEFDISTLPVWAAPKQAAVVEDVPVGQASVDEVPEEEIVRADPGPSTDRATASVITARATIHTGPGDHFSEVGELVQRDRPILQARDETNRWVFVWSYRGDGWVKASNLELSVDINTLPIWSRPMQTQQEVPTGKVSVEALNLRSAPNTDGQIYASLLQGQRVSVLARNEAATWIYASSASGAGWLYRPLVNLNFNVNELPVRVTP